MAKPYKQQSDQWLLGTGVSGRKRNAEEAQKELLGVMELFYILNAGGGGYTAAHIHQNPQNRTPEVNFTIYKLYHNKPNLKINRESEGKV